MRKTLAPILGALSFLLALPLLAASHQGIGPGGCLPPPPPDYVNKTTSVEIRGQLQLQELRPWMEEILVPLGEPQRIRWPESPISYWQISISGETYRLDFGSNKELLALAGKLNGKAVLVTGTVTEYMDHREPRSNGKDPTPAILYLPFKVKVVRVQTLQVIDTASVHETVQVEVRGTLDYDGKTEEMYPQHGYFVTINGQRYGLDFAGNWEMVKLAKNLRGQTVVVTGKLVTRGPGGFVNIMPHPQPVFQFIVVTDLHAAPLFPPLWREPAFPVVR